MTHAGSRGRREQTGTTHSAVGWEKYTLYGDMLLFVTSDVSNHFEVMFDKWVGLSCTLTKQLPLHAMKSISKLPIDT